MYKSKLVSVFYMKYRYVVLVTIFVISGFALLTSWSGAQSQSEDVNTLTINNTDLTGNTTVPLSSISNFTAISEDYATSKRLESTPSLRVIDKEAAVQEFEEIAEQAKENLDRFEVAIPQSEKLSFNALDVFSSNLTAGNTSLQLPRAERLDGSATNSTQPSVGNTSLQLPRAEMLDGSATNSTQSSLVQDMETPTITTSTSNISKSWKGLDIIEAGGRDGIAHPPDVTLAVGPDHVVQMVHSAAKIWDKNGQELQTAFLADFFNVDQYHSLSDPIVLYDPSTERWFSVIMETSPLIPGNSCVIGCFIDVAASESRDPTGLWKVFRIPFGKALPDYPMVGISNDKLVFGVNLFLRENQYLGAQAVIVDKNSMIQNNNTIEYEQSPIYEEYYTIYPVSSNTDCMYMEANDYGGPLLTNLESTGGIALFVICGNPTTNNLEINVNNVPVLTSYLPPEGDQPSSGKGERILGDTNLNKIRGPLYMNDSIVSALNVRCINENGEPQSCIRVVKIGLNETEYNSTVTDISANDAHLFYPSLSIGNDGNIVMVMGVSSTQIYPSGLVGTIDQNMNNLEIMPIVQGSANTNPVKTEDYRPRSGDYFTAVKDPVDGSVWVSGEYGDKNVEDTPLKWSTFVANIS